MAEEVTLTGNDLEWWVDKIVPIYEVKLKRRTPIEVWSKVTEHGSAVGEAVREANFKDLVTHLAQTLGWVTIFFNQARHGKRGKWGNLNRPFKKEDWDGLSFGCIKTLGEIVLYHYPLICPHCLDPKCRCVLGDKKSDDKRLDRVNYFREHTRYNFDKTWAQFEARFSTLYAHDDKIKSHADIGFHFLEEIGEVVKALRMVDQLKDGSDVYHAESPTTKSWLGLLVEEVADVISWSTSVIRRVKLDLDNYCELCPEGTSPDSLRSKLSLEWALRLVYLDNGQLESPVCPKCKKSPCEPDCDEF